MAGSPGVIDKRHPIQPLLSPVSDWGTAIFSATSVEDEVLLLLAVGDGPDPCSLLKAASIMCQRRVGPEFVDQLLRTGHVALRDDVLTFTRDDAAPMIMRNATSCRIQRAHEAWADVLANSPLARSRHRLLAVNRPSEETARLAVDAARESQATGNPEHALEMLREGARLWPSATGRSQSLVEAAATAFALGRPDVGRQLLHDAAEGRGNEGPHRVSTALLSTFAGHTLPRQPDPRDLAEAAATLALWEQPLTAFCVLAGAGSGEVVQAMVRRLADKRPGDCALAALAELHQRNFSSTLRLLIIAGHEAKDAGLEGILTQLETMIGEIAVHLGDQARAGQALCVAQELSRRTRQAQWAVRAGTAQAIRGVLRESADRDQLVRHAQRLDLSTDSSMRDRVDLLEAMSLAADDRWTDAFDVLRRLAAREPNVVVKLLPAGLLGLLADAAVHCGRSIEGRSLISRIAAVDTNCEQDIELAELLYATAVLSDESDAEICFGVALALHPRRLPFLHARTSLAYGSWLRRRRRAKESRSYLLRAHRIFDALGLPTWTRRAQAELRASGLRSGVGTDRAATRLDLSPQELEISQLVARGLSNRQIGEVLHLSPRTIGSHLYRIFPKLDVTSRHQLAALLDTAHDQAATLT